MSLVQRHVPTLIGFGLTAFAAETAYGCTSFGPAIIVHIGSELLLLSNAEGVDGTVAGALAVLTVIDFSMACVQMGLLRSRLDWRFSLLVAPLFSVCVAVGCSLLVYIPALDSVWLKMAIGILLACMLALRLGTLVVSTLRSRLCPRDSAPPPPPPPPPPPSLPPSREEVSGERPCCCGGRVMAIRSIGDVAIILATFACAGIMGGLVGPAGPPMMLFVLVFQSRLDFDSFRGTSAVLRFWGSGARGLVLLIAGKYTLGDWPEYVTIIVCSTLGLLCGNGLAGIVPHVAVMMLISTFLFDGALLLSTAPATDALPAVRAAVLALMSVTSAFALLVAATLTVRNVVARCRGKRLGKEVRGYRDSELQSFESDEQGAPPAEDETKARGSLRESLLTAAAPP